MSLQNISLRQLRYFAAAAESGRLSLAANQVHVSQSTITTAILQLESTLKTTLFQRQPHGVSLTAEGSRFYQRIRHVLDSLEDAVSEPDIVSKDLTGTVRIAASYTLLGYFLPSLLGRFRARHPNVIIDLLDMNREDIENGVRTGIIDVGVVLLSNMPNRQEFDHALLVRSTRQLWTSAAHPLLEKGSTTLANISQYPYIQITVDEGEDSTERYWRSNNLQPDIAFRTSSMEALRGLIAHGFGVTILSDMVYRHWSLEGKRIEAIPVLDPLPPMEVGLIWQSQDKNSHASNIFREFLISACRSQQDGNPA
ncbi:LysR family transcriptional regulator [Aestuariicella hydrocarbonica]|uniref:LysR family transcriptional regulator n=1 Tax=Pseudomaricurvus hydrocarbonicus TaxID=1470433 RepID=A0A9E5JW66_9GAMM|nr:LysR family transcriptional regulator [Aestuariicella hydrocarbonica]NHO66703.1 LysR family transcriptional regulator [Aestuariicella hydrocarbonica]